MLPSYAVLLPSFNVLIALSTVLELELNFSSPVSKDLLPFDNCVVPFCNVAIPLFKDVVPCFTCVNAVFRLCIPFVNVPNFSVPLANFCVPA